MRLNADSLHEFGPHRFWTTEQAIGRPPFSFRVTGIGNGMPFFHTGNINHGLHTAAWHYRQMMGPTTITVFTQEITEETRTKMVHEMNLEQYRAALRDHDWHFDFSEDPRVRKRGQLQRDALEAKRRVYDPDYSVWNTIAPSEYRRRP